MLHDCIYQFLRLFYHSRFKPTQLEMTWAQFATPVIDVVLVVPLILKLVQNISGFTNEAEMRLQSELGINGISVSIMQKYVFWCSLSIPDISFLYFRLSFYQP